MSAQIITMDLPDDQIKAFLDAAPDSMVIIDGSGRIAFVNVETEALFEYSRAELMGQPVEMLLPERLRGRHEAHVLDFFVAPRRRPMGTGLELYGRRKDGTEFPVEVSLSPVLTERGTFVSSAIRDITDRKAIESKLVEAREFAERANRAKSAFLAAASHDLRQPLQTLALLSSALSRIVPSDSKAATAVASQSEALRLMSDLLNALLDISKLEAGVVKPDITDCSVRRIFARLRTEFAAVAEAKGLDLIVEDCDDVVRTDPTLLGQVIQNLLANAIRYTREGWVRLRCLTALDVVRIEVLDTGVGIAANELDLIFNEYYQSSRRPNDAREGVGLGLSIARRIASLLNCSLEVTSTLGQGSCFALRVPRSAARVVSDYHSTKAAPIGTPSAAEQATVLVIEDDVAVGEATAMLLSAEGMHAIVAADADAALNKLSESARSPSLLICDYHLGSSATGVDAIRAIREAARRSLPTILVSGDTSRQIVETVNGIDACHLLSKPVDADRLLELCARLLQGGTILQAHDSVDSTAAERRDAQRAQAASQRAHIAGGARLDIEAD